MPPSNFKDLTNKVFGRLTVINRAPNKKQWQVHWNCECTCGNTLIVSTGHLRSGHTKSCGCLNSELSAKRVATHDMSKTVEYATWCRMRHRCNNSNNKRFKDYGGRGIKVCEQWLNSFMAFFNDMGKRPTKKHSIDRINNDLGYSKNNCKWSVAKEQANNRKTNHLITIDNVTKTIAQWSDFAGLKQSIISERIQYGWPPEKAIFTPVKHHKPYSKKN